MTLAHAQITTRLSETTTAMFPPEERPVGEQRARRHHADDSGPELVERERRAPGSGAPVVCRAGRMVGMSATTALIVIACVWVAIGLSASLVMGRRGHSPWLWLVLGAVLGPLAIAMARSSVAREREARPLTISPGTPGPGPVDVLVGIDDSPQSHAALQAAIDLLGPRIGRLALAGVLDYDTGIDQLPTYEREQVLESLRRSAAEVAPYVSGEPETVLLTGAPADAMVRYAADQGFGLLVVGSRGRGASKMAFGSVASRLARGAAVPVFVVAPTTAE